jgi:hypothetical protein
VTAVVKEILLLQKFAAEMHSMMRMKGMLTTNIPKFLWIKLKIKVILQQQAFDENLYAKTNNMIFMALPDIDIWSK